ncbi:MAG: uracil phosphoribosyltransferase [Alphaproteobacteria bacterium]|nr:uracil phosphoribosyltransferase [Alphaproteobacteria bacterium]
MTSRATSSPPRARLAHHYGSHVHILDDAWARTLVTTLSHPDTVAPHLHQLLEACYRHLLAAAAEQLPRIAVDAPTRMTAQHPSAAVHTELLDPQAPVVVVDIARGGMVPSYVLQQALLGVLRPEAVRVDHLYMQRVTDASGHVTGVATSGSKIGGPVAGATVLVPDPMGATGGSLAQALDVFRDLEGGPPARMVALHLIVTPEYLRHLSRTHPTTHIYALRVDRGLSAPDVLAAVPGARWDEERGLDAHDYIVPGAGGLGELINNAFV